MSKKLLYALSGGSAMTLRKLAREDQSPVSDRAADELKALDRDAAVERMADVLEQLDGSDYADIARAALEALTNQEDE